MKNIIVVLFAGLVMVTSCKSVVLRSMGVRTPKKETPESLVKFLTECNGPVSNNFIPIDSVAWRILLSHPIIGKEVFGTFIFNKNGLLVNVKDTGSCQWSGINAITKLHPDSVYQVDSSFRIQDIEPLLLPLMSKSNIKKAGSGTFTVLMTWARFMGPYNNRIFIARDNVEQNEHADIRLIFVNLDMQKSWNLTSDQRIELK